MMKNKRFSQRGGLVLAAVVASAITLSSVNPAPALAAESAESITALSTAPADSLPLQADADTEEIAAGLTEVEAAPRFLPALVVLALLARIGIGAIIRQIGKTALKNAAKSYLLKATASRWSHIMASKHHWAYVGARSKSQVAEVMSNTMAHGKHSRYGTSRSAMQAVWRYKNKTVVVTYSKNGGQISNGWVK